MKISQDNEQTAFLFNRGRIFKIISFEGRLYKSHKLDWSQHKADKVIVATTISVKNVLNIACYELISGQYKCINRESHTLFRPQPFPFNDSLAKLHLKTHMQHSRAMFLFASGKTLITKEPISFKDCDTRRRYITPDVVAYRYISFVTFYVRTKNYVRWAISFRDYCRNGDNFTLVKHQNIKIPFNIALVKPGTVLPVPEDYVEVLPPLEKVLIDC